MIDIFPMLPAKVMILLSVVVQAAPQQQIMLIDELLMNLVIHQHHNLELVTVLFVKLYSDLPYHRIAFIIQHEELLNHQQIGKQLHQLPVLQH